MLDDITPLVTLWHGSDDRNVPPAMQITLAEGLPRNTVHRLEGQGHLLNWEKLPAVA